MKGISSRWVTVMEGSVECTSFILDSCVLLLRYVLPQSLRYTKRLLSPFGLASAR